MAGSSEYTNEVLGFRKGGVFTDQLSDCKLLKKLHGVRWIYEILFTQTISIA
jgi:hypothetical protein